MLERHQLGSLERDRDIADDLVQESVEQVGRGFWGSVGHDLEDVAAAGAVVGLGVLTGGLADAAIGGTIGVLGEMGVEAML